MVRPRRDSRREQRRTVDVSATISINDKVVEARTRDVSRGGMCLVSDTEIPRDTELKIQLVLSLDIDTISEPLLLTGRTIWCTALFGKYQVGVIFVQVNNDRRRFLDLFMRFIDGEISPGGREPGSEAPEPPPEDKDDPFRP
jgi:hypothetical protein